MVRAGSQTGASALPESALIVQAGCGHGREQAMKRSLSFLIVILVALTCASASPGRQDGAAPDAGMVNLANRFVDLCSKGQFTEAVQPFDDTMRGAMPPAKLEETWNSLTAQIGPFQRRISFRMQQYEEYHIIFVTCQFEKISLDVKVVFNEKEQISGLWFVPAQPEVESEVPSYIEPGAFDERDVTVGTVEWALPATLTMPAGDGPFPAVVLVHGSGPHDRDETLGPNKPFRDLAWGLATRGIAVLRYEKRTKAHAQKLVALMDHLTVMEETVEDALSAASLLRETTGIEKSAVFMLGHSLGAMLAPRIGTFDTDLAGLIILAGPTRPMEDLIVEQSTYIASSDGTISEIEKEQLEQLKKAVEKVKDPALIAASPSSELPLGIPATYWLDLHGYKPEETAKELAMPMLILQGERDYQVTMEDFAGWKLAFGDRANVTLKSYPTLNHLFMEGEGKSTPNEYFEPGNVAVAVIDDIAGWIKSQ